MSFDNQLPLFQPGYETEFIKRKRQKNIRIRVRENRVIVSGPWFCREKVMRDFLEKNRTWVERALNRQRSRTAGLEKIKQERRHQVLLRGRWLPLRPSGERSQARGWQFRTGDNCIRFTAPVGGAAYPEPEVINAYLKTIAKPEILSHFAHVSRELPFRYNKVFIRSQKTKWGTCSGQGNLSFNWRLIKCPCWIWDYLFIHELCHTVHFNHSKAFWELVNHHFPRTPEAKAWIRKHGDLIFHD